MKKQRILWIDILRGIAMFLVVYGHTSQNAEIKKYIYAFHMPLFFIISGMTNIFEKEMTTKEFMLKKVKTLIIPYFLLNLLMLPLTYINGNIGAVKKFTITELTIGTFYSNNLGSYDAPSNATWFITTLFLVEVLFFYMKRFLKNDKDLLFCSGILGVAGYADSISKYQYDGPWHIQVVFTAIVFYCIGYLFMNNIEKIKQVFNKKSKTILFALTLFIVGIGVETMNTRVSLTADKYGSIIYFYIAALTLSFSLIILIMKFFNINLLITKYVGQNCILWIAIQIPIIRYTYKIIPVLKEKEIYTFLLAIVIYLVIIPISLIINKFLPFICGKKYKNIKVKQDENSLE